MTNTKKFRDKVESSGITFTYLAKRLGITREALYKKMKNETEFKASEIMNISKVLRLTENERNEIFFAICVY